MTLLVALTLFVLAVFLGLELITKVPATLHTPLMSGSNAISGITLIGALVSAGSDHSTLTTALGVAAVALLFGAVQIGGQSIQTLGVSSSVSTILQAFILFGAIGAGVFSQYRIRLVPGRRSVLEESVG